MKAVRLFVGVTVLGFSGISYALDPTTEVNFSGKVTNVCEFPTPTTPGKVVLALPDEKLLDSKVTGGEAGKFRVRCTGNGKLSITVPSSGSSNPSTTTNAAAIYEGASQINSSNPIAFAGKPKDYLVHMTATGDDTLLPGDYSFTTTVTVAAQ